MMNKNEWKKVKLEDVFELQIGRTPSRNNKNYWDNGSNNWISISDIKENEKYIEKTKEKITNLAIQDSKIKLVPKNTVIMSFKLSVGKTAITSQDIYTNEAIVAFIPKVLNLVDNNFLYYYLQNINWKDGINKAVKGLTLNKPLISNKIIFLPDLKVQKQIAKKLDTIFSILNLKKQQLLELDKLVKFQFLKMFGEPISNVYNMKCISDIANICRGASPRPITKYVTDDNDGVNWIKIGDVTEEDMYITHTAEKITKDGAKKSRAVKPGDFILSNSMSFGRPYLVGINGCVHDGWLIISEYQEYLDPLFFYYELRSDLVQRQFNGSANGSCVKNLNSDLVKKVKIYVPPKEQQMSFADFVKQVDKSKVEKFFDFEKAVA